jgi:hypothetical protein
MLRIICVCLIFCLGGFTQVDTVRVDATPGHAINSFDPDSALGSSIDVLSRNGIDKAYSPHIVQESLSAGWGPITYRNNTELRIAAWHWTENGAWSDAAHKSGYFTGSSELREPLRYILSYSLPHRGFSRGRTPGGNLIYWKSNPYLTSKFTGESDGLHPQWAVVDLRGEKAVDAVRIAWAEPYAKVYQVQYWVGQNPLDFDGGPKGEWKTSPSAVIHDGRGGTVMVKLAEAPVNARYLRLWMTESSNTCDEHGSQDVRNCVGYAVKEITAGTSAGGSFTPVVFPAEPPAAGRGGAGRGGAGRGATAQPPGAIITTSSIDPWHSAEDVNGGGGGQHSGFDVFFTAGLTNNLPAMIPVTMLYGTPEDAAAQIAYVEKRDYPIAYIEMGEEPDGKKILPEDYAALYLQWATAIHKVDPKLKLGGPIFEGVNEDIRVWPDAQGRTSWMGRFVAYLKAHNRLADLTFVSFEHYPFGRCDIAWKDLYREPQLMKHILDVWREVGVPKDVPLMVTESSISAGLNGHMSRIFAALWLADSIGAFFEGGGAAYYHSPIQPQGTQQTCQGWGSWSNFESDNNYEIKGYTSFYWAAHMINLEWAAHRSGTHQMYPSSIGIKDGEGNALVTSYALKRSDGNWSLMLVNRDENNPHSVRVLFEDSKTRKSLPYAGAVNLVTFGSEQYVWKDDGPNSHADPDGPPVGRIVAGGPQTTFVLPKASVTVLRGRVAGL